MSTIGKGTKTIDFWPWRHREAKSGEIRRTLFQLTLDKTGAFPEARPIAAATSAGDEIAAPDFAETTPDIGRLDTD